MTVLVCTSSTLADRHVPRVIAAVESRGAPVVSLDTARFPLDVRLSLADDGSCLRVGEREVPLSDLTAVWNTHTDVGSSLGDDVDADYHDAVALQSELALLDALALVDVFQLDHPQAVARVPIGLSQLGLARAAGLDTPRTLVSNDPDRVRAFAASCGGSVVAKMMHSSVVKRDTARGPRGYSPRVIGPDDLADIERVTLCPMIFQERVPRALELRVTVVGERVFAAAVDTSRAETCDWADDPALVRAFRPYELPSAVRRALLGLLDRLELNFSTADLILTPEGRFVFLEINVISFYDFIEDATGLPISDAIADLLSGRVEPRVRPSQR